MNNWINDRKRSNRPLQTNKIGYPKRKVEGFRTIDVLLGSAQKLFESRQFARTITKRKKKPEKIAKAWSDHFHSCFSQSKDNIVFVKRCRQLDLDQTELEILLITILFHLEMLPTRTLRFSNLFEFLSVSGETAVMVHRLLQGGGKLTEAGLLSVPERADEDGRFWGDHYFIEDVIANHDSRLRGWVVENEKALWKRMASMCTGFLEHSESRPLRRLREMNPAKKRGQLRHVWQAFEETLCAHPEWKTSRFFTERPDLSEAEKQILAMLVSKEVGAKSGFNCFNAGSLAEAVALDPMEVECYLELFSVEQPLVKDNLIQPCEGNAPQLWDNSNDIEGTAFELTQESLDFLDLKRTRRKIKGLCDLREGHLSFSDLVLPEKTRNRLSMALAQAAKGKIMMNEWGLKERFPYGRGVVVLFYGPPGTGKTASAEAIAQELGRPLLTVDYSQIQNCFVGQTEKNIVRIFSQARKNKAVLFWDEADAMFYDRDSASRNWEVRDVNVLLQEIEKYEGVCVLSTNRCFTLDAALERRISLKIEFERPNRATRRSILEKLMPPKLPLTEDVCLDRLAQEDLTGGELKNVILNAARIAVAREEISPVTMADFLKAIEMEVQGRWNKNSRERLGFESRC